MLNTLSLAAAVKLVEGQLEGYTGEPEALQLTAINTLADASNSELSFLANKRYRADLHTTQAAAVLVGRDVKVHEGQCVIRVDDAYLAFAYVQRFFHPQMLASGQRHASAVIDATATLADDVEVDAGAVIGANVAIASGSRIGAGCIVGAGVQIGHNTLLHPKSVIADDCILGSDVILQIGAVIGSDGFGYAWSGSRHVKIPQAGRVIIKDDVEIGANTCIDRGAIGDTVIERGVKLDNQIQIAHNVRIGAYSVMASQVGISGSTSVGSGCQFGGQTGLAGHLRVGDGVTLAGKSGVISDLAAGGVYAGFPAMPHRLWLKVSALTNKLPELWQAHRNNTTHTTD